jgi:hypothetical protein
VLNHIFVLNPAVFAPAPAKCISNIPADFWLWLLNDEAFRDWEDLEKLVIGCELIAAIDAGEPQAA